MSLPSFVVLCFVPFLIVILDLVDRKISSAGAGWLGGFPIVGGPALLILTLQHGAAFGAKAADHALLGVVGWSAFIICYRWKLQLGRMRPPHWLVIVLSVFIWAVLSAATTAIDLSLAWLGLSIVYAITLAFTMGSTGGGVSQHGRPVLVARVALAVSFVLVVILVSYIGGPRWSGVFTAFPIVSSALLIPSFLRGGPEKTYSMASGMLTAGPALAVFMLVASYALRAHLPVGLAFVYTAITAFAVHILIRRLVAIFGNGKSNISSLDSSGEAHRVH